MKLEQTEIKVKIKTKIRTKKTSFNSYGEVLKHLIKTGNRIMVSTTLGRVVRRAVLSETASAMFITSQQFNDLLKHDIIVKVGDTYAGENMRMHVYGVNHCNVGSIVAVVTGKRLRCKKQC